MGKEYTRETWKTAYAELLHVLHEFGIPEEVGKVIAQNLHSERSIRRMTSYMRQAHPRTMEEIADEMFAIMENRERWIRKKEAEEANAGYSAWLNSEQRLKDEDESFPE